MVHVVVAAEEEQLVSHDRPAESAADLVHSEIRLDDAVGVVRRSVRVQRIVAKAVGGLAVEVVRAGLGAHRDNGLTVSVLSAEVVRDHADFHQAFGVRHHGSLVVTAAHYGEAVELNVVGERAAAVDAQRGPLAPALDADAERVQRGAVRSRVARNHASLQHCVEQRVLRDVRDVRDHLRLHRTLYGAAVGLDLGDVGRDLDGLLDTADLKFDVDSYRLRGREWDARLAIVKESRHRHRNCVGSGRKVGNRVLAGAIRFGCGCDVGFLLSDDDVRVGNDGPRRVLHCPADRARPDLAEHHRRD